MSQGLPIRVSGLSKAFGPVRAVQDVTFTAAAGRVTGFVGPNGAGKSTTLRMLLGLIRPDAGSALFGGTPYRELPAPTGTVGAVLDLAAAHPATSARAQLRTVCDLSGHDRSRVDAVIETVELTGYADRKVRGFSTGMRQRLALATALLGDPGVLVLDEPSNGLDPAGIVWLRTFLRSLADEGRTVLISSHVLTELQYSVDDLVLIDHGRIAWSGGLADFTGHGATLEQAFLTLTANEVTA
ncbi:ABC-2 type transport system ATP-binding protein [Kribbella aluminosa]|uniref:ABC-2 type transport system ATP-binding protein n=1 Tax=Kribbella aluminosa TaxID=416017 RepID=A0ABS4V0T3_9ACTN|nr:ATP-binding cassette domain-containing protein [Kribbella aluminosa]MBP2357507.1 ABC-2 type transport system ATP-binding protein [Kribbella aluminosa]